MFRREPENVFGGVYVTIMNRTAFTTFPSPYPKLAHAFRPRDGLSHKKHFRVRHGCFESVNAQQHETDVARFIALRIVNSIKAGGEWVRKAFLPTFDNKREVGNGAFTGPHLRAPVVGQGKAVAPATSLVASASDRETPRFLGPYLRCPFRSMGLLGFSSGWVSSPIVFTKPVRIVSALLSLAFDAVSCGRSAFANVTVFAWLARKISDKSEADRLVPWDDYIWFYGGHSKMRARGFSRRHVCTRCWMVRLGAMRKTSVEPIFVTPSSQFVKKGALPPRPEGRGFRARSR
jgi:hypothetical protein